MAINNTSTEIRDLYLSPGIKVISVVARTILCGSEVVPGGNEDYSDVPGDEN